MRMAIHVQHYSYINKCISEWFKHEVNTEWSKTYGFQGQPYPPTIPSFYHRVIFNRMQRLLCLRFPVTWSLQLLSRLDHVICTRPIVHKLSDDLSLILLTNAQSWFVSRLWISTFHTMAWVLVCSQPYDQVSWSNGLFARKVLTFLSTSQSSS